MKPAQDIYDRIPELPPIGQFFTHFPGVYCRNCGETFALYSFSAFSPSGLDENRKPFYHNCHRCAPTPPLSTLSTP